MTAQRDPDRLPTAGQPPISVRTLGVFEVLVNGVQKAWEGKQAGTRQLQRAFGYLVFRRDHPVKREVLTRVAGGHGDGDRRYVIADLARMVKGWGLDVALRKQRSHLMLLRHSLWSTDTDRLGALFEEAQEVSAAGQHQQAIELLETAQAFCCGEYLSIFPPRFDPLLDGAKAKWQNIQKQVLVTQARLCMAMPDLKRREQAFQAAVAAITFDSADSTTYWLASECARLWGNAEIAHTYAEYALEIERQRHANL
jgi:hypothetical protein